MVNALATKNGDKRKDGVVASASELSGLMRKNEDSGNLQARINNGPGETAKKVLLALLASASITNNAYADQAIHAPRRNQETSVKDASTVPISAKSKYPDSSIIAMNDPRSGTAAGTFPHYAGIEGSVAGGKRKIRFIDYIEDPDPIKPMGLKQNGEGSLRFSISRTEFNPNHYGEMRKKPYGVNIGNGLGFMPLPMDMQNATIAYLTYVVKHKQFGLYSRDVTSGKMAITLGKGNHGEIGLVFSLTF